jgi:hypothetical protein
MTLLDIAGSGMFTNSGQFLHVLGDVLKLLGGSLVIGILSIVLLLGLIVRSVLRGIRQASLVDGLNTLIRSVAYVIGIDLALLFVLVATTLFSISALKTVLIAAGIVFVAAFIARETFLFFILKKFGKYIFYLTTLHRTGKVVYAYVKPENSNRGENPFEKTS